MPQKLTDPGTITWHPKLLLTRPAHAIAIAVVASEWAALENNLIAVFTFCLFALHGHDRIGGQVAETAWYNLDSLKTRLDLLEAIAAKRIPEPFVAEFNKSIRPEIRKRAAERNRIVHGHWATAEKYPTDLILMTYAPEDRRRYSVKDLEQIADRIIGTSDFIATFWHRVEEQTRPEVFRELERRLQEQLSHDGSPIPPDKSPP